MATHPNKEFRQFVKKVRDPEEKKEIYKAQEQRKILWPSYNNSKIHECKNDFQFIRESVNKIKYEQRKSVGRPPTDKKSLVKAILVCEAVGLPERQAQGFLEIVGHYLGLHEILDDRVISNAYDDPKIAEMMYQLFLETKSSNGRLGGDGTGLERSRKDNYEATKKKKTGQYMTSIVDSREVVQAFDISGTQECQVMHELVKIVQGHSLRLDAGFNDRELAKEIAEKGMKPFIFPRTDNNVNGDPYWQEMYLTFYYDIINWLIEYHQRSHTESFHSSFKRTFGILTKLKLNSKFVQVCARIIIHNARRLSYFDSL